jgi:HK97 gp10 family phage protein
MADVEVKGLKELHAQLTQFSREMNQKVLNAALMPAGRLIRDSAKELAPVYQGEFNGRVIPGLLKREIRMARARKPVSGMDATVIIGVRKISKKVARETVKAARQAGNKKLRQQGIVGNPFYWRFMEFGFTDRAGVWHGPHGGSGFLRPALTGNTDRALTSITDNLRRQIAVVARKTGFKFKAAL